MEPITVGIICVCALLGWGAKEASSAVSKHSKQKTKQAEIDANKQIEMAKIKATEEANRRIEVEKKKDREEKEENNKKIEDLKKQSKEADNNSKDPNLSEEDRRFWASKHRHLEEEIKSFYKRNQEIDNHLKDLNDQQKKNDKTIADTKSKLGGSDFDIKDYLNIETALVVGGCIVLYKLLKDKD